MAYGILVHDAAVYADDPSRDDRLRAELFQKAAQGYQCDVRLPDDDVHEESGNMEAGPPCLRAAIRLDRRWRSLLLRAMGVLCGLILLPLSVLPMLFVINRSTETIGMTGMIAVFAQLVPMLCVIIPTEHALRKNFDKNGNRKEPKSRE